MKSVEIFILFVGLFDVVPFGIVLDVIAFKGLAESLAVVSFSFFSSFTLLLG